MLLNKEKAAGALEDHEAEREPSGRGNASVRKLSLRVRSQRGPSAARFYLRENRHTWGWMAWLFFAGKWIVFLWVRHPGPIQILLLL